MTLYQDLTKAGCEIDSHESDLYVKATPEAVRLVILSGFHWEYFRSQLDGLVWIDVPFAYDPFWEVRKVRVEP